MIIWMIFFLFSKVFNSRILTEWRQKLLDGASRGIIQDIEYQSVCPFVGKLGPPPPPPPPQAGVSPPKTLRGGGATLQCR
jgi:hypothetical protein